MLGLVVVVLERSLTFDVETQWSLDGFSISRFGHFDSNVTRIRWNSATKFDTLHSCHQLV